jgi:predicted transposase YdaD
MKRTTEKSAVTSPEERRKNDDLCKFLAEEYPEQFAHWLFGTRGKVKVEKTELSRDPIRADSVILSSAENETLHTEFQTTKKSDVALPLQFLDYYVGLKRKRPKRRVRQVLVVLKPTEQEIPDRYEDECTMHRYTVVKMWEQDPAEFLKYEGLLPLATLCRAESGAELLQAVATGIAQIKSRERRAEALNGARMLAGLRDNKTLIYQILKENDMLEESVVYQDILRKGRKQGRQSGLQEGLQQGESKFALLVLDERFGKLAPELRKQIECLSAAQLEALGKALVYFKEPEELIAWLQQNAAMS